MKTQSRKMKYEKKKNEIKIVSIEVREDQLMHAV